MTRTLLCAALVAVSVCGAYADPLTSGYNPGPDSGTPAFGADPVFEFSFTSNNGTLAATGTLDAYANGDGTYTATTGTLDVLIPDSLGLTASTGTLIANPTPTGEVLSPSGFFIYDDQLLPGQNPLITNGGLLFTIGGQEVNIFSNGVSPGASGGTYQFYSNDGNFDFGNFAMSPAPVPEPFTMGLGLAGIGIAVKRRKNKLAS
jgi:hypothetical protein